MKHLNALRVRKSYSSQSNICTLYSHIKVCIRSMQETQNQKNIENTLLYSRKAALNCINYIP